MAPSQSDLPPWLRKSGASPRGGKGRAGAAIAFGLVVFAAGVGAGFLYARRDVAVAPPPAPPPPVCPPAVVCPAPAVGGTGVTHARLTTTSSKHAKTPAKVLAPLPEKTPMDEGARTQALHAFAQKKGEELRECVPEPDRGPSLKLGAAFEISSDGAVDFVQILGSDASPKDVKRCYVNHMKRWRFPEELLRGDEKLLVNFVL